MNKGYIYCVYDTKDNDVIVCMGYSKEIEKFLNKPMHDIWQYYKLKTLVYRRYRVEKLGK